MYPQAATVTILGFLVDRDGQGRGNDDDSVNVFISLHFDRG